jgi:hypothetical protein
MQKITFQLFLVILTSSLSLNFVFSQEKKSIFQEALWIKSNYKTVKKEFKRTAQRGRVKKIFQF